MPFLGLLAFPLITADPEPASVKDALKPFNVLVGTWKGTGTPDGPPAGGQGKDFWTETITWGWQFKGADCWLVATFENGRHLATGELRYLPGQRTYQFTAVAPDKTTRTLTGTLSAGRTRETILTVERTDDAAKRTERLVFTLLHSNRHLYRFETRPAAGGAFARQFQVGATKEGEPFATANAGPECVVSGGRGTMPVTHKGVTYYVCCSGCRDAFREDPEKYIREAAAKKK